MSLVAKENISIRRKDVKESKTGSLITTKTLIFKHEASLGEMVIDTTALVTPAESLTQGFVQPSLAEVSAANLLANKHNLKIHSSRGVWLQIYDDFRVTGANKIMFVGNIELLGGALEGEVFTIYATPIQSTAVVTTDHKRMTEEYLLLEGETVLNLGREFEVNRNPLKQVGAIRIWRNGIGPQLRNVNNAAAAPLADGNFHEVDAGNGIGIQVEFNIPPSGQDDVIIIDFGLEYAGDYSLVGDIDALYGSVLKLAEDVKDLGPYLISRYLNANPSQVERRTFGDTVLDILRRLIAPQPTAQFYLSANFVSDTTIPINFDVVEFDFLNNVTTSPTAWKFTVGAGQDGLYHVHLQGKYNTSATYTIDVYKNGVFYRQVGGDDSATSTLPGATLIRLVAGDYIDFRTSQAVTVAGGAPIIDVFRSHGFIRRVGIL